MYPSQTFHQVAGKMTFPPIKYNAIYFTSPINHSDNLQNTTDKGFINMNYLYENTGYALNYIHSQ